jgi:hypothetical protein
MLYTLALITAITGSDTLTVSEAREAYKSFVRFELQQNGKVWTAGVEVDTLPDGHVLAAFVRVHKQYLTYIVQTAVPSLTHKNLAIAAVRDSLREAFYERLRTTAVYDTLILGPIARYLEEREGVLTDFTAPAVEHLPIKRVTAVAARFYNPDILLPDGRFGVHICVVKNGMFDTLGGRNLGLEGAAFAAVWDDTSLPDSMAFAGREFSKAHRALRALPNTGTPAERIARAQEQMWSALEGGDGLAQLMRAYVAKHPSLPFRIDTPTANP